MDNKADRNKLIMAGVGVVVSIGALVLWYRNTKDNSELTTKEDSKQKQDELIIPQELIRINFAVSAKAKKEMYDLVREHRLRRRKVIHRIPEYVTECQDFENRFYEIIEKHTREVLAERSISKVSYDLSIKSALETENPNEAHIALRQLAQHTMPVLLRELPPNREILVGDARDMIKCRVKFFKSEAQLVRKDFPREFSEKEAQYILDNLVNDYTWKLTQFEYEDFAPLVKANTQFVVSLVQKEANNEQDLVKKSVYGLSWPTP